MDRILAPQKSPTIRPTLFLPCIWRGFALFLAFNLKLGEVELTLPMVETLRGRKSRLYQPRYPPGHRLNLGQDM
jgi:hypothetical protein